MYNYFDEVKEAVKRWLRDNPEEAREDPDTLFDLLWCEDSVTGNGSGSYTFNSYKALENLFGNEYLIEEVSSVFGLDPARAYDWEYLDVSIRCYVLDQVINEAIDEYLIEIEEAQDEK